MRLRLASWNTWKNDGAYRARLPAMAAALNALAADVVLLQECFRATSEETAAADTCAYLAQASGLHPVYAAARRKQRLFEGWEQDSESGHALLSRWPLAHSERLELPTTARGGERIALLARLNADVGPVLLACVHFSHVRSEHDLRRQQFECVMSRLAEMAQPHEPVFIGGDFNCARGDEEWERAAIPSGWTLCDAVDVLGLAQPTFPVPPTPQHPGRRIDFVLAMHRVPGFVVPAQAGIQTHFLNLSPGSASPSSCHLPAGESSTAPFPSDHALIWTDWVIRHARQGTSEQVSRLRRGSVRRSGSALVALPPNLPLRSTRND